MTLTGSELAMRERALAWASDRGGNVVTRDAAINEEQMALDVLELLDEVVRLRALPATVPPTPGIPDHLQLNMVKVRDAIGKLTAERDALAARLAEATNLDSRDAEIIAARSELRSLRAALAAMTAARDEACDIADRHIFAPTSAVSTAAAPAHWAAAQPLSPGEAFTIMGNVCAAPPPVLGQAFTIDTRAPHRDKARIAELRKAGAK